MRRWIRRTLLVLSLAPALVLALVIAATRASVHLLAHAADDGDCVLFFFAPEGVTLLRATGWPEARPLTWESFPVAESPRALRALHRPTGSPRIRFASRTETRLPGIVVHEGRAELHTRLESDTAAAYLVPATAVWPSFAATAGPSWLVHAGFAPLCALAAIPPLTWLPWWAFRRGRAARRRRRGLCLNCGYDVRATDGRCPECGAAVTVR